MSGLITLVKKSLTLADHGQLSGFAEQFTRQRIVRDAAVDAQIDLERAIYLTHQWLDERVLEEMFIFGQSPRNGGRTFILTQLGYDFQLLIDLHKHMHSVQAEHLL